MTDQTDYAGMANRTLGGQRTPVEERVLLALVALKIMVFCALAVNTRFVMDEFWHFAQANYFGHGFFETIFPEKAVGYAAFFKVSHWIGWDAVSKLLAGRLLTVLITLGLLWLVYAMAQRQGHGRLAAAASVLLLLSFSTFMERAFRLRSEPLAIAFAAAALWVCLRGSDRWRSLLLAGILSGMAFVTTQKAVYFNVALGVALVTTALMVRAPGVAMRRGALLLGGWALAVAGYALSLGGFAPWPVLRALVLGPLDVALNGGRYYPDIGLFVTQTLTRNALAYALCAIGLILTLRAFPRLVDAARVHTVFTVIVTALIFSHDQPWPYVFTMALPFMASYGVFALTRLATLPRGMVVATVLGAAILLPSLARNLAYIGHDNRAQLSVLRTAEALMPSGAGYFDGIGMVPTRDMAPRVWLDARGIDETLYAGADSLVAQTFQTAPPEVVIETYRLTKLDPLLGPILSESYLRVADNILMQGALILPGETRSFQVLRARAFVVVARGTTGPACAQVMIDGLWRELPPSLDRGHYLMRSCDDAGNPVWLIPAEQAGRLPISTPERRSLFVGIYQY
ncbi:glycosyltransferase family 39 protein [Hoeflea sp.]|uniref:DUF7056 domain-containing protein n=1 Tax=Hoeflea sp. TaxID=1940281 RepID=UPI0019BD8084|nr:glycosyltransferase family 39 protein [Hoeflea sp.]MBC7285717.1 glycosyltransferase family 39 protein [Hoeflea sp.]